MSSPILILNFNCSIANISLFSTAVAPVVSNVPLIQTVIAGTLVTVRCDVMCEGNDIITWTKSGRIVASSNGTSLST